MVYLKYVENVIPLSKLIGLLFLFCLLLLSILFLKTKRNNLARPEMGTIFLVYTYLYHSCRSNSHGLKMIFPGNFLSGIVYFSVISPLAVYISLLFSLTTAAAVSSSYIMIK